MIKSLPPPLLAFFSATLISFSHILYRRALTKLSSSVTTMMVGFFCSLFACGLYFLEGGVSEWPLFGMIWFVMVGLVGNGVGRFLNFRSVQLIGLARTSVLIQTILVWSSLLAVAFLGETISFPVGLGTLAIMFGGVLLVYERDTRQMRIAPVLYLVPILSAFLFATTFLFRRYGLALIPSPPFGMALAQGSGALSLLVAMPFSSQTVSSIWHPRDWLFLVIGSFFNIAAAYCFWTSIQYGRIVEVVPVQRLSVLIIIFLSWLFFRKQEAITFRVVLGGVLSVAGAFAIVAGK